MNALKQQDLFKIMVSSVVSELYEKDQQARAIFVENCC